MTRAAALPLFPARGRPRPSAWREPPTPEEKIHAAVVELLRWAIAPGWIAYHPANGEWRGPHGKKVGARLKALGVLPGVPDLILWAPGGMAHGLEIKSRTGRLSVAQKAFRANCDAYGRPYAVARSLDEAAAILAAWGALRCSDHIPTTSSAA
jgi:hypothetical protein